LYSSLGATKAGRHGRGAAKYALQHHGAVYGQGVGLQGQSYAIPTKDENLNTLPLTKIRPHIDEFLLFAEQHPHDEFNVTRIGCGLAGYKDKDIAPMFLNAPKNCFFSPEWIMAMGDFKYGKQP
jgi:hypothetical protein